MMTILLFILIIGPISANTLSLSDNGDGNWDVGYTSNGAIGGFQFNVDGAALTSASDGAAGTAGFMISTGGSMVLGFSLTGATIPSGEGTLVVLSLEGSPTGLSNIIVSDAVGGQLDFTYESGDVEICNDETACNMGEEAACEYPEEGFNCDGIPTAFSFNQSTSQAAYFFADVLIDGVTVAPEDWVGAFNGDICVGAQKWDTSQCGQGVCSINVMGNDGNDYTAGYCNTGDIPIFKIYDASEYMYYDAFPSQEEEWVLNEFYFIDELTNGESGCTDPEACNYNSDATEDDGSCEYAQENYDCYNNCIVEIDCTGECGGSAELDVCGICGGNGIPDGDCDCNGNIDLGCGCGEAGPSGCDDTCNSTLEFDECGICGGNGIPDGDCDCNGNIDLGCGCGEAGPSGCDDTCGSTLEFDECGICGGNGIPDGDCDCNGNIELGCGCGEAGPSGCDEACNSTLEFDECGICGGNGTNIECWDGSWVCEVADCPDEVFVCMDDPPICNPGLYNIDNEQECVSTGGTWSGYLSYWGSTCEEVAAQFDGNCEEAPLIQYWFLSDLCPASCGECCDDEEACNPNGNGDCEYAQENYNCDGSCVVEADCAGECGGDAVEDECDVCNGDGTTCANDVPVAVNVSSSGNEGGLIITTLIATDVDNTDPTVFTFSIVSEPTSMAAMVSISPVSYSSGTFTAVAIYPHDGSETTSDSFTYMANDGTDDSNVATATIAISAVNDAPIAAAVIGSGTEGGVINTTLIATDVDDSNPTNFAFSIVSQPINNAYDFVIIGTVHYAAGTFTAVATYTHDGSATTSDSFTYMANDGDDDSNVATVTISITPSFNGCTDLMACNYDSEALEDDGSCEYPQENYDCDGNCIVGIDCAGECGGSAVEDECGVCNGNNLCVDDCGVVNGNNSTCAENPEELVGTWWQIYRAEFPPITPDCSNDPLIELEWIVGEGFATIFNSDGTGIFPGGSNFTWYTVGNKIFYIHSGLSSQDYWQIIGNQLYTTNYGGLYQDDLDSCVGFSIWEYEVQGCNDLAGCNYNEEANLNDGSCELPEENFDCDGDCIVEVDCNGECGGISVVDDCGICGGDGPPEGYTCDGIPELFSYNQSSQQAFYYFYTVTINGDSVDSDDWVGAFNGDICVGAHQWNISLCNNGVCDLPIMGVDISNLTEGYMQAGDVPSFKIFDASNNQYFDALASENIPWGNLAINMIDNLQGGIIGCMDESACNFNNAATVDNMNCTYSEENYDCDGNCIADIDCTGECDGPAVVDECGVCEGSGPEEGFSCNGTPINFIFNQSISQSFYYIYEVNDLLGDPLTSEDWVAVFNGNICVGSRQWDTSLCNSGICDVPAMGDDGVTPGTENYLEPGDFPNFQIYDYSEGEYFDAYPSENFPFANNGIFNIDALVLDFSYSIPLHQYNNLMSFYVLPEDNSVSNVMFSIQDNISYVIGESESAQLIEGNWAGYLTSIDISSGYWINMTDAATLTGNGHFYNPNRIYNLQNGANLVSFPAFGSVGISFGLPDEIEDNVIAVIGEGYSTINTSTGWEGSLLDFKALHGYWVITDNDINFSYNLDSLETLSRRANPYQTEAKLEGFDFIQSTQQAFYYVDSIELLDGNIEEGDWLISYCGNSVTGKRQWFGRSVDIPVMGFEGSVMTAGYCGPNDTPHFKLLKPESAELILLHGEIPIWKANGIFILGRLQESLPLPNDFTMHSAFPNPFNPITQIEFAIPSESHVEISIFDLRGQKITTLINNKYAHPGNYSINWDASNVASGVYFVHFTASGNNIAPVTQIQKLMLIK